MCTHPLRLNTVRPFTLVAATVDANGVVKPGKWQHEPLDPGIYELRAVDGDVLIKQGDGECRFETDVRVSPATPLRFVIDVGQVTLAAATPIETHAQLILVDTGCAQ
jgi:hypothetical protein